MIPTPAVSRKGTPDWIGTMVFPSLSSSPDRASQYGPVGPNVDVRYEREDITKGLMSPLGVNPVAWANRWEKLY